MTYKRSDWLCGLLLAEEYIKTGFALLWVEKEFFSDEGGEHKNGVFDYIKHCENNLKNIENNQ